MMLLKQVFRKELTFIKKQTAQSMFFSVENFKSIEKVHKVDLSNLTVLAGANSSGKTSLIQALLLLKQTLSDTNSEKLKLSGPYVFADSLSDLIYNKKNGLMRFEMELSGEELENSSIAKFYNKSKIKELKMEIAFRVNKPDFHVYRFAIDVILNKPIDSRKTPTRMIVSRVAKRMEYNITYGNEEYKNIKLDKYSYSNFFITESNKNGVPQNYPLSRAVRDTLIQIMEKVSYIAPLRVAPVLDRTYNSEVETKFVVPNGENTRFIIDRLAKENPLIFNNIKNWICKRLNLAKDFKIVRESGDRYRVEVTTERGLKVALMHMGLGLSQVLPVVTQGCLSVPGSLFIVEEPDVHMHPSVQAAMADFMIYLCREKDLNVLVETHSDHFITRLRRRVAEGEVTFDKIHLIFVENVNGMSVYETIGMSVSGRLEGRMPRGFMDSLDEDFRAILKTRLKGG